VKRFSIALFMLVSALVMAQSDATPTARQERNTDSATFVGTWVQTHAKWNKPPAELHLNERYAECAVLYFAANHDFALVYGTVIIGPHRENLSVGDGHVVYLGKWSAKGAIVEVQYQLVSRTVEVSNETLPGPTQTAAVRTSNGSLQLGNTRFARHQLLDDELHAVLEGEKARSASRQNQSPRGR
jgi:hypothetical protein